MQVRQHTVGIIIGSALQGTGNQAVRCLHQEELAEQAQLGHNAYLSVRLKHTPITPLLAPNGSPTLGGNDGRSTVVADTRRDVDVDTRRKIPRSKSSAHNLKEALQNDLTVLRHIWFTKAQGDDHASRLESFYGPQAKACELCRAR